MLLDGRYAIDPGVKGEALVLMRNDAVRLALPQILQSVIAEVPVQEHVMSRLTFLWKNHQRLNQPHLFNGGHDGLIALEGLIWIFDLPKRQNDLQRKPDFIQIKVNIGRTHEEAV